MKSEDTDQIADIAKRILASKRKKEPVVAFGIRLPLSLYNELMRMKSEFDVDASTLVRVLLLDGIQRLNRQAK